MTLCSYFNLVASAQRKARSRKIYWNSIRLHQSLLKLTRTHNLDFFLWLSHCLTCAFILFLPGSLASPPFAQTCRETADACLHFLIHFGRTGVWPITRPRQWLLPVPAGSRCALPASLSCVATCCPQNVF